MRGPQHEVLVGDRRGDTRLLRRQPSLLEEAPHRLRLLELDLGEAGVEVLDVVDADRLVVLGAEAEGPRLDPEVHVLGDQHHLAPGLALGEGEGGVEDPVVVLGAAEEAPGVLRGALLGEHPEAAVALPVERHPAGEGSLSEIRSSSRMNSRACRLTTWSPFLNWSSSSRTVIGTATSCSSKL